MYVNSAGMKRSSPLGRGGGGSYLMLVLLTWSGGSWVPVVGSEGCEGLVKKVLSHNSPEYMGHSEEPGRGGGGGTRYSFSWSHVDSLIKDCAGFYLLERRRLHYEERVIAKRETSYSLSRVSPPTNSSRGSFLLPRGDCGFYSVRLGVSPKPRDPSSSATPLEETLHYSEALRIWPRAASGVSLRHSSPGGIEVIWPPACPALALEGWKLLALGPPGASPFEGPYRTVELSSLGSPTLVQGLIPCTSYELLLVDGEESPLWSRSVRTRPLPPEISVIPGHGRITLKSSPSAGSCAPSPRGSLRTEVTYCTQEFSSSLEGSGSGGGGGALGDEEDPGSEETCLTKTFPPPSTPGERPRLVLGDLAPCTFYSLRFRTVDMNADRAENTLLQEYDAAHSTLCLPRDVGENNPTVKSPSTPETSDGFWFDRTPQEEEGKQSSSNSEDIIKPDIRIPEIHRTRPNDRLGLDVAIGISLGLSCLFFLIGATIMASVFHLYYNNRVSHKFSKISHFENEDEEDDDEDI